MDTLMYIHGYGSTGQAMKARLLQTMFPNCRVAAPTLDYDNVAPADLFRSLRETMEAEHPVLLVGSSMGGYYALCCTQFFDGTVWCVNPVREVEKTIAALYPGDNPLLRLRKSEYAAFDRTVFRQLHPCTGRLHFALSTDDELLGDHSGLLRQFPGYGSVVWKADCGHRFLRFSELQEPIRKSLGWSE